MKNPFCFDGPLVGAKKRECAYVLDRGMLDRLSESVRSGRHVSLLGPRLCGKTTLLDDLSATLRESDPGIWLLLLDARQQRFESERQFYESAASLVAARLGMTSVKMARRFLGQAEEVSHPCDFSLLLRAVLADNDVRVVFAVDQFECLHGDVARSVLRNFRVMHDLRAVYSEYKKVALLVCGSVSPYSLTLEREFPFAISDVVLMADLPREQAADLVREGFRKAGVRVTDQAVDMAVDDTQGDRYILQRLCHDALSLLKGTKVREVGPELMTESRERIVAEPLADKYLAASFVRLQSDTRVLNTVLDLMDQASVPYRDVATHIDIGEYELTGAVRVGPDAYLPRNRVYAESIQRILEPFVVQKRAALGYIKKAMEFHTDLRQRQVYTSRAVRVFESTAIEYRKITHTSDALSLLAGAVRNTRAKNMSPDHYEVLRRLLQDKVVLGMTAEGVAECRDQLIGARFEVGPSPSGIRDYLAFLAKKDDPRWLAEYKGMYVCFVDGQQVGANRDEAALVAEMRSKHSRKPRFITLVGQPKEEIDILSDLTWLQKE